MYLLAKPKNIDHVPCLLDSFLAQRERARKFSKSKSLYRAGKLEIFPSPRALYREETVYDDSHLVSFGASLFQVQEPI